MEAREKLIESIVNGKFQWRDRIDKETKYHGLDIVVQASSVENITRVIELVKCMAFGR